VPAKALQASTRRTVRPCVRRTRGLGGQKRLYGQDAEIGRP